MASKSQLTVDIIAKVSEGKIDIVIYGVIVKLVYGLLFIKMLQRRQQIKSAKSKNFKYKA